MRRIHFIALGIGFGLLSAAMVAIVWPKPAVYQLPSETFQTVLVVPDAQAHETLLHLVFPSSEAANPFEEGLAHYVEHLALLSSLRTSEAGWEPHRNAWTSPFSTVYRRAIGPEGIGAALCELVSVADPISLDERFALEERDIVLREYGARIAEQSLYPVLRELEETLYGEGGLGRSVIGEPAEIAEFSLENARALHRASHSLSQAILLIYGNFNPAEVKIALQGLPSAVSEQSHIVQAWLATERLSDHRAYRINGLTEDTLLYRKVVPLGPCGTPAECAVISEIAYAALDSPLDGGLAGPLRFDAFIARRFSLGVEIVVGQYALLSFEAVPDAGISLAELERAFIETLEGTLGTGLQTDTVERARARIISDLDRIPDDERASVTFKRLLTSISTASPFIPLPELRKAAETVSASDINAFLKGLLGDGREVTRLISGGKEID